MTATTIADPHAFIRANTRLRPVPLVPEIAVFLADESAPLWQKTEDELNEAGLPPPFWAFAWAGGQALARYVLDHPDTVRDRYVLDLASGSGLAGIAAMKAGAAEVTVSDIDAFAIAAAELNADSNQVILTLCCKDVLDTQPSDRWQTILAGDIFYERDTAARAFAYLADHALAGATDLDRRPRALFPSEGRAHPT